VPAKYLDTRDVPLGQLERFPGNARRGDVALIAESLARLDQYRSLVVRDTGNGLVILAGNHTFDALGRLGRPSARCELVECDDDEARRINAVDNRSAELGTYDDADLAALLTSFDGDYVGTGWTDEDLQALLAADTGDDGSGQGEGLTEPDAIPEPEPEAVTRPGDLLVFGGLGSACPECGQWAAGGDLGHVQPRTCPVGHQWEAAAWPRHALLCGDSTNPEHVAQVLFGQTPVMVHADPPYGMGKEADGIANDNLYGPKLDAFQMAWWQVWRDHLAVNGSAYIWGNAPDLWRLWWRGGLGDDDSLMVRNEIVWDKASTPGMASNNGHSYPIASERCLFLMRGQQFLGNQNKDEYWEGYEPLRVHLVEQRDKVGWTNRDANGLTGTQMAGHWFSQSQFIPISRKHYEALAEAAAGRAFTRDYDELFAELFPEAKDGGNAYRRELAAQLREQRTPFDNTHDVWQFGRVAGEERYGHATPKPVDMIARTIKTSTRPGDLIAVPFAGTGPEFIAAHHLGRRVAAVELEPRYVDVIARRWAEHTGDQPHRLTPDGHLEPLDLT
jgi:hypothetical protein